MDKETLSNYGWIVICVLVLAVMLAFATPFGTFIADGFKATYTGLFQTGDSALDVGLNAVGVSNKLPCGHGRKDAGDHTQKECGHYNCQDTDCGCVPASCGVEGHWSNDGMDHTTVVNHTGHTYACQCTGWVVPEGGTYYVKVSSTLPGNYGGATAVYNAGEQLPCGQGPMDNDAFVLGDYEYRYNKYWSGAWMNDSYSQKDWCARVLDTTKTSYGELIENINGKPLGALSGTFNGCSNLITTPHIPSTVERMIGTFTNCSSLTVAPDIPSSVTHMGGTFHFCRNLNGTLLIPCHTQIISNSSGCPLVIEYYHIDGCDGSCGH